MRPRRSVIGPLILIMIGVVFLARTVVPDLHLIHLFAEYWPYLLILWGVLQLIEVLIRTRGPAAPVGGITGGGWFIVVLLILLGTGATEFRDPGTWWHDVGFQHGIEMFGNAHDFALTPIDRPAHNAKRIVIEAFRGDAKIVGGDGDRILVAGQKSIRTLNDHEANGINDRTPVDVLVDGDTVVIRCRQEGGDHTRVSTNLNITVPRTMNIDATGREGDFDISGLTGSININSDNAGVHIANVTGDVKVSTRRSDQINVEQVKGNVAVDGHGDDVTLSKISGSATVTGDFTGSIRLAQIDKPVRVESLRTKFNSESVTGEISLARGSLDVREAVGPVKVETEATDVSVDGVRNSLEITDDKGDIDIKPGHLPLADIAVHAQSGDIELTVPQHASLTLSAKTENGDIENELGAELRQESQGHRSQLEGNIGKGPNVSLNTDRGTISIHRGDGTPPAPPAHERQPKTEPDGSSSEI